MQRLFATIYKMLSPLGGLAGLAAQAVASIGAGYAATYFKIEPPYATLVPLVITVIAFLGISSFALAWKEVEREQVAPALKIFGKGTLLRSSAFMGAEPGSEYIQLYVTNNPKIRSDAGIANGARVTVGFFTPALEPIDEVLCPWGIREDGAGIDKLTGHPIDLYNGQKGNFVPLWRPSPTHNWGRAYINDLRDGSWFNAKRELVDTRYVLRVSVTANNLPKDTVVWLLFINDDCDDTLFVLDNLDRWFWRWRWKRRWENASGKIDRFLLKRREARESNGASSQ